MSYASAETIKQGAYDGAQENNQMELDFFQLVWREVQDWSLGPGATSQTPLKEVHTGTYAAAEVIAQRDVGLVRAVKELLAG